MRQVSHIIVILLVLLGFGVAKLQFESKLSQNMIEQKLIHPPLKKGTHLQLGQTGAAVALGGLRSLVASIWNLRAFHHFENIDWIKLEESYDVITTLQPQTTHYWKTGAWHLHTNASVYYNENPDLSPMRRSHMRQKYIKKGSSFLQQGVTQNPDNWRLHLELARLWSDPYKKTDLTKAIQHYRDTLACKSLPEYERAKLQRFLFYTMTKSPEHSQEAYTMGVNLFKASSQNHLPNLSCCLFGLQNLLHISKQNRITDDQLFPSKAHQIRWLKNYWNHRKQNYPMHGVQSAINSLENKPSS